MKEKITRNLGILTILGGVLLLLNSLSALPIAIAAGIRIAIFLAIGTACITRYTKIRSSGWLIAGLMSIAIAAVQAADFIGLEKFRTPATVGLLGIGLLILFAAMGTRYWWAAVPGMLFLSFAMVDLFPTFGVKADTSEIPLIGLGIAFLMLLIQPVGRSIALALTVTALALIVIGSYPLFVPGASIQGLVLPAIVLVSGILLLASGRVRG